jgi:Fic family protein
MIFQPPTLEKIDSNVLSLITGLKDKLRYTTAAAPTRWYGTLYRTTLARNILGSNSIEGYKISRDDALAAVENVEPIDEDKEAFKANSAYRIAMTYVLQLATDLYFSYSPTLIKSLHYMMLEYDLTKSPGKWRPGPINIFDEEQKKIVYEAPDSELVPGLMDELSDSLNRDGNVPRGVLAAMGHLNLVMIHPFRDGNGRMGRCLQALILARDGSTLDPVFCSIEEYLGRHPRDYYDVLAKVGQGKWNPYRDSLPWVRFCLAAHYIQAQTYVNRVKNLMGLWDRLEKELQSQGLPARAVYAVADAALGWKVRNSTYRKILEAEKTDSSEQIAGRDLKELVVSDFLVAVGSARGRHYVASERTKQIKSETVEKIEIKNPYETSENPSSP